MSSNAEGNDSNTKNKIKYRKIENEVGRRINIKKSK
jgi:hypothetical protein